MQYHDTEFKNRKLISISDDEQDLILAHFCGIQRGDLPERYLSNWLGEFLVGLNDWCPSNTMERCDLERRLWDGVGDQDDWAGWQDIRVSEAVEFLSTQKLSINPEAW